MIQFLIISVILETSILFASLCTLSRTSRKLRKKRFESIAQ